MIPRSIFALAAGGLVAIAAAAIGIARQIGVKSYGSPTGPVVRAGEHLAVLMETRDPFFPSLKGRNERDMSYSFSLWLVPASGRGNMRTIQLDRGVRSADRSRFAGVLGGTNGTMWLRVKDVVGIDTASGQAVNALPPPQIANMAISEFLGPNRTSTLAPYRTLCVKLADGTWLALADELEAIADLKPGTPLQHNATAIGSYRNRGLYAISADSGPTPRLAIAKRLPGVDLHNAAFMRSSEHGEVVRFTRPEGFLIVYEAETAGTRTFHFARLNADGSIAWTAETQMGRLNQILPHDAFPAFVGERRNELSEPMLAVLRLEDGVLQATSLKGPLN